MRRKIWYQNDARSSKKLKQADAPRQNLDENKAQGKEVKRESSSVMPAGPFEHREARRPVTVGV